MKIFVISLFLLITTIISGQEKYIVYFKDKGKGSQELLKTNSAFKEKIANNLTSRCIERRKKVLGEEYILFEDIPINEDYVKALVSNGIVVDKKLNWFNAVSCYLNASQLTKVYNLDFVDKIDRVKIFKNNYLKTENNLQKNNQNLVQADYGSSFDQLNQIGIIKLHKAGITGKKILIGVLDSGFEWRMLESLKNMNILNEYDFVFNDSITYNQANDVVGQSSHGTSVLSIIGGFKDSTLIGGAYGASFILAKTENTASESKVEEDNYAAALEWMEKQGVDIVTSSLGYSEFDDPTTNYTYKDMDGKTAIVTKAAEKAFSMGVLTISSAGNEGNSSWYYITAPADGFNTIAVGAVDNYNTVAGFSSRGPTYDGRIKPDVVALGVNVYKANASSPATYSYGSGTSFSAPLICSGAALVYSIHPQITNVQLRKIILESAQSFKNPDNSRGYGLAQFDIASQYPVFVHGDNQVYIEKFFLDTLSNLKLNLSNDGGNTFQDKEYSVDGNLVRFANTNISIPYFYFENNYNGYKRYPESGYYFYENDNIGIKTAVLTQSEITENNFPNPFKYKTNFRLMINEEQNIDIKIYDILGKKVKQLYSGKLSAGYSSIQWDGSDDEGQRCSSGIYLVSIHHNKGYMNKKIVFLK